MKFSKYVFLLLVVLATLSLYSQDKKTIYITLDISYSMQNEKYEYANYGAQVIAAMNSENDVYLIVGARKIKIKDIKDIQKGFNSIIPNGIATEIADIEKFNSIFDPNEPNQEIFIIGDGKWERWQNIEKAFQEQVETGNLRVTFLETLVNVNSDPTAFEVFLNEGNLAKIYKTDNSESIIKSLNTIVEEISGVSSLPESEYSIEGNCIHFSPLLDVQQIQFLYQDDKGNKIAQVKSISIDGKTTSIDLIAQPSTASFQTFGGLMSSNLYKLDKEVKAGASIELCFNKKIVASKLRIFPIVDMSIASITVETDKTKTKQIDANTTAVCNERNKALVKIDLNQNGVNLSEAALKKTVVKILSDGKQYNTTYKDSLFVAEIPLTGKETAYRIEGKTEGYKQFYSGQKRIIKTAACELIVPVIREPEIQNMQSQNIGTLRLGNGCDASYKVKIVDEKTGIPLDPTLFDISVNNNYKYLFKRVEVSFVADNFIQLDVESRGFWCSCFTPDEVQFDFVSRPKDNQLIDGASYKELHVPLIVTIDKSQLTWYDRCGWIIVSMLIAFLLGLFFLKLSRKDRFRKGAKIILDSPSALTIKSLHPKYNKTNFNLRNKGFFSWLNRWLNPFNTENNVITFSSIDTTLHFYASKSFRQVEFPKSNYNKTKMQFSNYDEDSNEPRVVFDENTKMKVKHRRVGLGDVSYYLNYDFSNRIWNDIRTFRFVIGVFLFALIAYIILATILIILSII